MRFTRCPWPKDNQYVLTSRKIAATKRRLAKQREAVALLPDLVAEVPTLEEELASLQAAAPSTAAEWRAHWAANWRCARRRLAEMPEHPRRGLLRYWAGWGGPTTPEYLLVLIRQAAVEGRSFWTQLRQLRQFFLIGQKRFPLDRIPVVFARARGSGKFQTYRSPEFYSKRRAAKAARRAGTHIPSGRGFQMPLSAAAA